MSPKKIELKEPVQAEGKQITSMTMRGPKVRDLIASEKAGTTNSEREVYLFSALCDVPEDAIHDLALADYTRLQEAYQGFLS